MTDDMRHQDPIALLDALTDVVHAARAMPMSASVLVNRAEVLDLVEQIRASLPEQLSRADEVLSEADGRLADAEEQAERIIAAARARAAQLVTQEQVAVQAQAHAHEIVERAQEESARLRHEADDYCDRRLAEFEIDLGKVLTQVQAGRARLAERLDDAADSEQER
ncbi:hypothetical protein ATL41_2567 [Flavimobilis soli]|uniref:Cell division septum initiation protein DivIVA n=1 Tax=Flavimobilis soli TaxID=442709 RepID=A0A2A9EGY7_9MICO|nr:hypothetical protein [Flavimobilis soli]PFG37791.1 hypothetical protein ATL41_2567 [Flavimobilis soli]